MKSPLPTNTNKKEFVSKDLCIKLHDLWCKPSLYYYEWTGATEIEELRYPGWLTDSINVYTANQMKRALPRNSAINENVVEFGLKPDDSLADKRAKVLIYLIENKIIEDKYIIKHYA